MSTNNKLTDYFDKIYVINLPKRADRRKEMDVQLKKIGLSLAHPSVHLFAAIRPTDKGEFPTIGTKGCFYSHYEVLKDADEKGYERILILEDDLDFTSHYATSISAVIDRLKETSWAIFYGGYHIDQPLVVNDGNLLVKIPSTKIVYACHFMGFQKPFIGAIKNYLSLMKDRKGGDPLGGPMHVDGAYQRFREEHPEALTYLSAQELGKQRSSLTDIHDNKWFDKTPVVKKVVSILRKIKNQLKH